MLTKLAVKIGRAMGVKYALSWIRRAAEGKEGARAKAIYWRLVGFKTPIGFLLAALGAGLLMTGSTPEAVAAITTGAGGFLLSAGLTDKAWRSARPAQLVDNALYRILAAHPVEVGGFFTVVATWERAGGGCAWGVWCTVLFAVTVALAAAAVQLGLLDAAWRAPAPRTPFVTER